MIDPTDNAQSPQKSGLASKNIVVIVLGAVFIIVLILLVILFGVPYRLFLQAEQAYKSGDMAKSTSYYEKLLNNYPVFVAFFIKGRPYVYYRIGIGYIEKDTGKAREMFVKVSKEYPEYGKKNPDLYYNLGFTYIPNEKLYLAGANFSQFLASQPREEMITPQMRVLMGSIFSITGKYYQAIKQLEKISQEWVDQHPDERPEYYNHLAQAHFGKKHFDNALFYTTKALESSEKNSQPDRKAHLLRALIFQIRGDEKNADKEIDEILKIGYKPGTLDLYEVEHYLSEIFTYLDKKGLLEKVIVVSERSEVLSPFERALNLTSIAEVYRYKRDFSKAIEMLRKAIEADPDYWPAYYEWGSILTDQEDYEQALVYDEKAAQIDLEHPLTRNALGWSYYNLGRQDASRLVFAEEHFQKALVEDPEFTIAYNSLGLVSHQRGDYGKALSFYNQALQYDPEYEKAYVNIGSIFAIQKDNERALQAYEKAIAVNPYYAIGHYMLGQFYKDQGRLQEALREFQEAQKLNPYFFDTYEMLAETYEAMGQLQKAVKELQKGLKLNDKDAGLYIALADVYREMGKIKESEEALSKGLSLQSKSGGPYHYNKGLQLKRQGKLKEAVVELEKALTLIPRDVNTHILLSQVYEELGEYEKGIVPLQKALTIDDTDINVYLNLGYILRQKGDHAASITTLKKAFEVKLVNGTDEKLADAYDELGQSYFDGGQLDASIDSYKKAIALYPRFASPHINLGVAYEKKGSLDLAISSYQTTLQLDPQNSLAHNNLGYTLALQGQIKEAILEFEKALEIDPNLTIAKENLEQFKKK